MKGATPQSKVIPEQVASPTLMAASGFVCCMCRYAAAVGMLHRHHKVPHESTCKEHQL